MKDEKSDFQSKRTLGYLLVFLAFRIRARGKTYP
jgi:hypothetical protein